MERTRLSTKGQIVLPEPIRTSRGWMPGTEFTVEPSEDGVLLRPAAGFKKVKLSEVAGCLKYKGSPKTLQQMSNAIKQELKRRNDRGRY